MVLRNRGIGEVNTSCNSCGQASAVSRTSVTGRCETSERRGYHVVQVSHDACELFVSAPSKQAVAAGSLARGMKSPTTKDLEELKRVGRYLRGRLGGATVFEPQPLSGNLEVFCDADHAGDLGTRKSRSRMAVMWEVTI